MNYIWKKCVLKRSWTTFCTNKTITWRKFALTSWNERTEEPACSRMSSHVMNHGFSNIKQDANQRTGRLPPLQERKKREWMSKSILKAMLATILSWLNKHLKSWSSLEKELGRNNQIYGSTIHEFCNKTARHSTILCTWSNFQRPNPFLCSNLFCSPRSRSMQLLSVTDSEKGIKKNTFCIFGGFWKRWQFIATVSFVTMEDTFAVIYR